MIDHGSAIRALFVYIRIKISAGWADGPQNGLWRGIADISVLLKRRE